MPAEGNCNVPNSLPSVQPRLFGLSLRSVHLSSALSLLRTPKLQELMRLGPRVADSPPLAPRPTRTRLGTPLADSGSLTTMKPVSTSLPHAPLHIIQVYCP